MFVFGYREAVLPPFFFIHIAKKMKKNVSIIFILNKKCYICKVID